MKNGNQKKHDHDRGGMNPVVAAVTGVVVGAGVVAGAVLMKDGKNREKLKTALTDADDQLKEEQNEIEKKAKKVSDSVKKSWHRGVDDAKKAAATK